MKLSLASSVLLLRAASLTTACRSNVYHNTRLHPLTSFIVAASSSSTPSLHSSLHSSASGRIRICPPSLLPSFKRSKIVSMMMSSSSADKDKNKNGGDGTDSTTTSTNNLQNTTVRKQQQRQKSTKLPEKQPSQQNPPLASPVSPPPLIDVDCNLLHQDLASLIPDDSSSSSRSINPYFRILHHPSTLSSNIRAVFSPSSTIDEAELLHPLLLKRTRVRRRSVDDDGELTEASDGNIGGDAIDIRMSVGVHPYNTDDDGNGGSGTFHQSAKDDNDGQNTARARIDHLLRIDRSTQSPSATARNNNDYTNDTKNAIDAAEPPSTPTTPFITCIGETGLDYSDGFPSKELQLPWFRFQLALAKEYDLPLFLHERLACRDLLDAIDGVFPPSSQSSSPPPPILVHCFTGSPSECREYVERGYYISLSGYVLKKGDGPAAVRECLRTGLLPIDRLMVETDAPYMGFTACRASYYKMEEERDGSEFRELSGKKKKRLVKGVYPNVPSALPMVLECVVECVNEGRRERREVEEEDVANILFENSVRFFGFCV